MEPEAHAGSIWEVPGTDLEGRTALTPLLVPSLGGLTRLCHACPGSSGSAELLMKPKFSNVTAKANYSTSR